MGVTYIGGAINNGGSGTVVSVTHGLSILDGDVVVAFINYNSTQTLTDNNGAFPFDKDLEEGYSSGTLSIFSRVAGGSEPAAYNFTASGSDRFSVIVRAYRGVDNNNIYDIPPLAANLDEGENTHPLAPSITTTNDGSMAVCTLGIDATSNVTWSAYTNGFTDQRDASLIQQPSSSTNKLITTAGVVGDVGATQSLVTTSTDWYAILFALNEESLGPSITDIDGDDDVQAGQAGVIITTVNVANPSTVQTVTLGGETLAVTNWVQDQITVTIPEDINLLWDTAYTLSVTDDVEEATLAGVILSAPVGWETQVFDGTMPVGDEVSLYSEAITDVTVGYMAISGDTFAWETRTGLTYDTGMFPTIEPPITTVHDYKVWDATLNTWSAVSTGTWTNGGDVTGPLITLNGTNPLVWVQGTAWVDPGATVTDGTDPDKQINADSIPDVNIVGTQTIAYNTTDVAGNPAVEVTRDVIVTAVDTTPDQFTFIEVANADISTVYENVQPITGIVTGQTVAVTGGLVSNDSGVTYSTSVGMLQGTTLVKVAVTTGIANSTEYTQLVTVNGVSDTFVVTTKAGSVLTFPIATIRTTVGSALTYTYPLGEIWTAVPEEGGVKLDSSVNVVIAAGTGTIQSSLLSAGVDYLLILRDAGNNPEHYARQWGQFA